MRQHRVARRDDDRLAVADGADAMARGAAAHGPGFGDGSPAARDLAADQRLALGGDALRRGGDRDRLRLVLRGRSRRP